jgi:hypothetical protein
MKTNKQSTQDALRCKYFPHSKKCDNCQSCKNLDDIDNLLLDLVVNTVSERK